MFSVNRLVGRTESRARDHGPEITPRIWYYPAYRRSRARLRTPSYPLVPAPPGPPVPVQPDKFNLACLVKTQSTASDERRISHHASILEVRRSLRPRGVRTARRASRDEAGTGPARRGGRVAYGLVRTTNPRATTRARPRRPSRPAPGRRRRSSQDPVSCVMFTRIHPETSRFRTLAAEHRE